MHKVAVAAGMPKVTVYKYFLGKDDLRAVPRKVAANFHEVFPTRDAIALRRMAFDAVQRSPELAAMQFHVLVYGDIEIRSILLPEMSGKADVSRWIDRAVDMFVTYHAPRPSVPADP